MNKEAQISFFLKMLEAWTCDGYFLDIRYIAGGNGAERSLWDALIHISPLPHPRDNKLHLEGASYSIGQVQRRNVKKSALKKIVSEAIEGKLTIQRKKYELERENSLDYFSDMYQRNSWYSRAHLQVIGAQRPFASVLDLVEVDNFLRSATTPFDGFEDVASWLDLRVPDGRTLQPNINIRVNPPIALEFENCSLAGNLLSLILISHSEFDVRNLTLAVRAAPDTGLNTRLQIADRIQWTEAEKGIKRGRAEIELDEADSALIMLIVGDSTVQRQWIQDKSKARNTRLLAVQHFDKELKMVRRHLLDSTDSSKDSAKFETSVAALLFLLGFTPAIQMETDAPDLIVTAPSGRIVLVECTMRIADLSLKIGKLVDRRESLSRSLAQSGHSSNVIAVLVCALPKSNIPVGYIDTHSMNVLLATKEDLEKGLNQLRFSSDPDKILDNALSHN